jgi:uncharacterized protein (DUF2267 family)
MAETGFSSISTTVDKTNRVLKEIEEANAWPKERRNESYAALRAVSHALRDRLTVEESAHLAAQLPMLIRGLYYEGWNPARVPVKMNKEQFLERVRQDFPFDVGVTSSRLCIRCCGVSASTSRTASGGTSRRACRRPWPRS